MRLLDHVYSEGGNDFEHTCPECGTVFDVEVEAIPSFTLTKRAAQQGRAVDAPQAGA